MTVIRVIWDLEDEPDGKVPHIAEHGITVEEYEEVLEHHHGEADISHSSGNPIAFGWTSTGKHIAVVWEHVDDDRLTVRPVTAYECPPPGGSKRKKGKRHGR